MPFSIIRQDITKMQVDAVVNAANTGLYAGGGVCGAIFRAAGEQNLTKACQKLSPINTGEAVITPAFDLPSKFIIHTAGPIYDDSKKEQVVDLLANSYKNSLELAAKNNLESIAFPLISSGIYGFDKQLAFEIARDAITTYLEKNEMDVYLIVYDRDSFLVSQDLFGEIESYINQKYVDVNFLARPSMYEYDNSVSFEESICLRPSPKMMTYSSSIDTVVENLEEPFCIALFNLIDMTGKTDAQVYKKANIDRKLFSKIRSVQDYIPRKRTIIALAISLELSMDQVENLLKKAGYALSHSQKFDVIIEYFIANQKYDIYEINEVLFKYDLPLLGS